VWVLGQYDDPIDSSGQIVMLPRILRHRLASGEIFKPAAI